MTELTNPIKIVVIGIMELNDGEKELRFRRDDEGNWIPDLIVNHDTHEVTPPPECFTPRQEIIDMLNAKLYEHAVYDYVKAIQ